MNGGAERLADEGISSPDTDWYLEVGKSLLMDTFGARLWIAHGSPANPKFACRGYGIGSQPQWFKRVRPRQPQVSESNARQIRECPGQSGILCGTRRIATAVTKSGHGIANLRLQA